MVEESPDRKTLSAGTRCVVLVGPSGSAPADLLGGLSRRGVCTTVVTEPAAAMVELARQTTGALIVIESDRLSWLDELIQAVKTYHPRTVRWGYRGYRGGRSEDPSGNPQLSPLGDDALKYAAGPQSERSNGHDDPPRYIVPDPKSPLGRAQSQIPRERVRSLVVKVPDFAGADEPLISEEELSMLLGPAPEGQGGVS
jgi:hypothetical protein